MRGRAWKPNILEANHSSALSMASSSNPKRYYHVFLSFRGPDVRKNFLSHLYAALDQNGLNTFVDSKELRKGEKISQGLLRVIEESRVAIIVFSKNYASSRWCLEELSKIIECKERNGLIVFPVFYKVEPREVRAWKESYGRAMDKHESKFGKDSEEVKRWKEALLEAGSLSGWELNDRHEAELIQCIVKELSIHLNRTSLHVAKYPVGIKSQVRKLILLLQKELDNGDDDVLMIGLWGPGGIGKTTIAKALYNAIEKQYQGCSFLARVRETSNQSNGLLTLQERLMYELLSPGCLTIVSVDRGISLIRERLCCKKVLVVLDDVDKLDHLNALAGKRDWFGKGSTIIVTSRDKHLLLSHDISCVYEVGALEDDKALKLFTRHAFPNGKTVGIQRDLIDRALHYAASLPLALEVLGSFLRGRTKAAWESTFNKFSKIPEPTINQVLKISFDGLEDNEKEIFLDIACFFKGKSIEYIEEVLNSRDFHTTIGIEILIDRSLIKDEYGSLQMHDLIQFMGKNIVNQECRDDPRKRSRLWLFEDVQSILNEDTGPNVVKAIALDLPTQKEMNISPNAFANMKKLRMLIFHKVRISSQGLVRVPTELRWFSWLNAPDLDFGSGSKKLVTLDLQGSHIRQLGDNFQNFSKLKSINFSECSFLASIPDLSSAPNLESLNLDWCLRLAEVHQSVGYLRKLKYLSLQSCFNLSIFPSELKTKYLQKLRLSFCSKLEKFPDISVKMKHLEYLNSQEMGIKGLPASIENLVSMKKIGLEYCKNLERLPSSIYKLKNLESLSLEGCSNFVIFPKNLKDSTDPNVDLGFQNLCELRLTGCHLSEVEFLDSSSFPLLACLDLANNKFTHLPTCINKYDYWKDLFADKRKKSQEIPHLPSNMCNSSSCCECKGDNVDDGSSLEIVEILINGREMPEWIFHCKENSLSFMFPLDLCDKFLGLALCVVLGQNEGSTFENLFLVSLLVNGKEVYRQVTYIGPLESDHVRLVYIPLDRERVKEKLLQNDWNHFQVFFRAREGMIKKSGFRLICEQKKDEQRVFFPTPSADGNKLEFQGKRLRGRQFSMDEEDGPVEQNSTKKMRRS
ncbi:disease resistance protein RPV1-like [Eucalyptus grandis]|uniref:disease resistance protein RPV1-like n=1 Tax=Eucalyptus grandis TaxID=71139 RepID=UPI00192EB4E9|nr:disease resistance protein RPV1-like [Eucalyptus grandis]